MRPLITTLLTMNAVSDELRSLQQFRLCDQFRRVLFICKKNNVEWRFCAKLMWRSFNAYRILYIETDVIVECLFDIFVEIVHRIVIADAACTNCGRVRFDARVKRMQIIEELFRCIGFSLVLRVVRRIHPVITAWKKMDAKWFIEFIFNCC